MNATINNTLAADARKAFNEAAALHARCEAEVAAGRFVYQGPSICGSEGDGVSSKVASDRALREDYGRAVGLLTKLLDRLVVEHTGFSGTFTDLVEAQRSHGYRPTFREKGNEAVAVLADVYDFVAGLWGLPETSYRPERQVAKVELIAAAKRLAKADGITGRRGGWLYKDGKPYCQGWLQLACRYIRRGRLADVEYRGGKRFCRVVS